MSKIILIVIVGVEVSIISCRPEWIGDSNSFLEGFVNFNFLSILGVILAITLASLAQIHLSLNRLEESRKAKFADATRVEILSAANWLIGLFVAGFAVVALKPLTGPSLTVTGIWNGLAIFILSFYVMILIDVTGAIFDIKADIK